LATTKIFIGHPGSADRVTGHVLSKAPADEQQKILSAIDESLRALPDAVEGNWARAMNYLHSYTA
jgi:PTH1 family peptidyl-tRNA hydrolase